MVYVVYLNYAISIPTLCSLVIVKCYAFSLSISLLCHLLDFISLMQFPFVVALVECWTWKWFFALNLLACMSGCSLFIVIVRFWSSHGLLLNSISLDCIVLAPYALQVFCIQWSYCVVVFQEILVLMVQELQRF